MDGQTENTLTQTSMYCIVVTGCQYLATVFPFCVILAAGAYKHSELFNGARQETVSMSLPVCPVHNADPCPAPR